MPILLTILLLVLAASALAILRRVRPQFRYGWLIATAMTALAGLNVLLWQLGLPMSLSLPIWKSAGGVAASPGILVNTLTWPYALSLVTLVLSVLLTAPSRPGFPNPYRWAILLAVATAGVLAVMADDTLTLVMLWAALDLIEVGLTLRWADSPEMSERAVTAFAVRLGGIVLLLLARVLGGNTENAGIEATLPPAGLLLWMAAAMRLGVLPSPLPYNSAPELTGGLGTTLQLSSAAASMVLLTRIPPASLVSPLTPILLLLCAGAALYAGFAWFRAPDQFSGRPFWMVGMASLAAACALRGSPEGATAWAIALILVGAALFLPKVQHAWLNRGLLIGAWCLSSLPFSLTAPAWIGNPGGLDWSLPIFLIAQGLLLAGFVQNALRPMARPALQADHIWVRGVYPVGIGLLVLVPFTLGFGGWDGAFQVGAWAAGIAVGILAAVLVWAKARVPALSPVPTAWLPPQTIGVRAWLFRAISRVYSTGRRISETVTGVLEGEAGIMWSLLFLALFVSLIAGRSP